MILSISSIRQLLFVAFLLCTVGSTAFLTTLLDRLQLPQQRQFAASMQDTHRDAGAVVKRLILIRHGISLANEYMNQPGNQWGEATFRDDASLKDARLSLAGEDQARAMAIHKHIANVELVVVSPLTRALQTTELGIRPYISNMVPIMAHPDMTERVYTSSDIGRPVSVLKNEFPWIDFELILPDEVENWWYTSNNAGEQEEWRPFGEGQYYAVPGEPLEVFQERVKRFRTWLASRPERTIVLVAHWAILREWTGDEFQNCESRIVEWEIEDS